MPVQKRALSMKKVKAKEASQSSSKRSLSVKEIHLDKPSSPKMESIPLSGVFDRNGNPVKNAFVKIPESQKKILDAAEMNSVLAKETPTPSSDKTSNFIKELQDIKQLPQNDPKRKLFLGAITGGLGALTGGVGDAIGGAADAAGGVSPGAMLGVGAAGAGFAARTARKEQHNFDKTKLHLQMNFEMFKKEYMEYEYTQLRECNIISARLNGQLSSIEKNLVYRVNNRILEMIDAA